MLNQLSHPIAAYTNLMASGMPNDHQHQVFMPMAVSTVGLYNDMTSYTSVDWETSVDEDGDIEMIDAEDLMDFMWGYEDNTNHVEYLSQSMEGVEYSSLDAVTDITPTHLISSPFPAISAPVIAQASTQAGQTQYPPSSATISAPVITQATIQAEHTQTSSTFPSPPNVMPELLKPTHPIYLPTPPPSPRSPPILGKRVDRSAHEMSPRGSKSCRSGPAPETMQHHYDELASRKADEFLANFDLDDSAASQTPVAASLPPPPAPTTSSDPASTPTTSLLTAPPMTSSSPAAPSLAPPSPPPASPAATPRTVDSLNFGSLALGHASVSAPSCASAASASTITPAAPQAAESLTLGSLSLEASSVNTAINEATNNSASSPSARTPSHPTSPPLEDNSSGVASPLPSPSPPHPASTTERQSHGPTSLSLGPLTLEDQSRSVASASNLTPPTSSGTPADGDQDDGTCLSIAPMNLAHEAQSAAPENIAPSQGVSASATTMTSTDVSPAPTTSSQPTSSNTAPVTSHGRNAQSLAATTAPPQPADADDSSEWESEDDEDEQDEASAAAPSGTQRPESEKERIERQRRLRAIKVRNAAVRATKAVTEARKSRKALRKKQEAKAVVRPDLAQQFSGLTTADVDTVANVSSGSAAGPAVAGQSSATGRRTRGTAARVLAASKRASRLSVDYTNERLAATADENEVARRALARRIAASRPTPAAAAAATTTYSAASSANAGSNHGGRAGRRTNRPVETVSDEELTRRMASTAVGSSSIAS